MLVGTLYLHCPECWLCQRVVSLPAPCQACGSEIANPVQRRPVTRVTLRYDRAVIIERQPCGDFEFCTTYYHCSDSRRALILALLEPLGFLWHEKSGGYVRHITEALHES